MAAAQEQADIAAETSAESLPTVISRDSAMHTSSAGETSTPRSSSSSEEEQMQPSSSADLFSNHQGSPEAMDLFATAVESGAIAPIEAIDTTTERGFPEAAAVFLEARTTPTRRHSHTGVLETEKGTTEHPGPTGGSA